MTVIIRAIAAVLFLEAFVVGGWNAIAPASFYDTVPTVDLTPPFSDHYARDFGWAMVGLASLLGWAALRPRTDIVIAASSAQAIWAVPHVFYHLAHLEHASSGEAILLTSTTILVAALTVALIPLVLVRDRRRRTGFGRPSTSVGPRKGMSG